jgi:hypothetical protein
MRTKYLLVYIYNNDVFDLPIEPAIKYDTIDLPEPMNITEIRMAMDMFGPDHYNTGTVTLKSIYYLV